MCVRMLVCVHSFGSSVSPADSGSRLEEPKQRPQHGGASKHARWDHMQTVVTTAELFFLHHVRTSAASAVGNNLAMLWRLIFFKKAPGGSHEPILKHF